MSAAGARTLDGSLGDFRRAIRAPIHNVISYVEMISDVTGAHQDGEWSTNVAKIIRISQNVLADIGAPLTSEDAPAFLERLKQRLQSHATTLIAAVESARQLLCGTDSTTVTCDADKLQQAAQTFREQVDNMDLSGLASALSNDDRSEQPDRLPHATAESTSTAGMRGLILVVDDNEENRDVLSRRLLRDGHEVMLAEGGRQAVRMLKRYSFDLVLLDIMMPDIDGYQVLSEIKRDSKLKDIPVIMITAVDETASIVRCIEMGADDYLLKPFNRILLRARINALLERKRLRDEERARTEQLTHALQEIKQEREHVQSLLLNILPAVVAQELEANGAVEPMYFEDMTVVFADIVGFTLSIEQLPADELVYLLHDYFTAFDQIIDKYALEKMKTIGDAYMFAGGVPVRSSSNPVDCALAALEMTHVVKVKAETGPVNWQLRIGLNTGSVIAGVVGIRKFAFDIWGDTVNFGSRMESSGRPGMVNLSQATYNRVKDFFECEKQEKVRVKEGRDVDTYLIKHLSARLIKNRTSVSPREAFASRYRTYFQKELKAFPEFLSAPSSVENAGDLLMEKPLSMGE